MTQLAITNVTILTMNEQMDIYVDATCIIKDNLIVEITNTPPCLNGMEVIDGHHKILLPGFINLHTHVPMVPFRSLQDDRKDRLRKFLFPLENMCMKPSLVYHSAMYGMAEMLLSGITTFVDMYYFEEEVANACDRMGMRSYLGETLISQETCSYKNEEEAIKKNIDFIEKWKQHPLIKPILAPHATNTVNESLFHKIKELSNTYDLMITCHVAEMDYEQQYFLDHYHMTPVQYLHSMKILSEKFLAAHMICVNEEDILIMKKTNMRVAHCIGANTKAAKGIAPVKEMLKQNIVIGLGSDGPSSGNTFDMFTQMKLFANFHKNQTKDRSCFSSSEILKLCTSQSAKALGRNDIGTIEIGKKADFILLDTKYPSLFPMFDPYAAIVYGGASACVDSVYVNGKCLVRDKKLIYENMQCLREKLTYEMEEFKRMAHQLEKEL